MFLWNQSTGALYLWQGVPDLWAVTPDGIARAYLISHLSATGPAKIEPPKPQKLS